MQIIQETIFLQNFILKVNRKGIYFIWMRLKSRKAELKMPVKVSLGKYVGMFRHDCRYIFTNTKPGIFRIPKNQSIPNTHQGVWFGFSINGLSNLNSLSNSNYFTSANKCQNRLSPFKNLYDHTNRFLMGYW